MSISKTFEDQYLNTIRNAVSELYPGRVLCDVAWLDMLEGASSLLGGFSLREYRKRFCDPHVVSESESIAAGSQILKSIKLIQVHPALAISALARPALTHSQQRSTGVYHTDFRLARFLASRTYKSLSPRSKIVDPACGSGILLVAITIEAIQCLGCNSDDWLAKNVFAADLSVNSLRGARVALSSFTKNLDAISEMASNWHHGDSLLPDETSRHLPYGYFDLVLANPPWEKVKATRHEYLKENGIDRHYGDTYESLDEDAYGVHRDERASYAQKLLAKFATLGSGEIDLYKPFLELCLKLAKPGGRIGIYVPAGLIRSQNTQPIREILASQCFNSQITVFENRQRFFAIDSRFKFLLLVTDLNENSKRSGNSICVNYASNKGTTIEASEDVQIPIAKLASIRGDLTVPEVRTEKEWKLFELFSRTGLNWGQEDSNWKPEIVREIDMTRDRKLFLSKPTDDALPLIEGRMIHQYWFGCKAYRSGTGRRARWDSMPIGGSVVEPQFWFPMAALPSHVQSRHLLPRAGFCDITGQTNERSMLASRVPPGVVCGNKVPTVIFPNDPSPARLDLWLGIVNSFTFDWLLRRVITTTVNYFLLLSVPLPRIEPADPAGKRIIKWVRELRALGEQEKPFDPWIAGKLRAKIDLAVFSAYGGKPEELPTIMSDFTLLDRGQPSVFSEPRSSVTTDLLMSMLETKDTSSIDLFKARINEAKRVGALPYIPGQFASEMVGTRGRADDERDLCYA